MPYTAPPPPAPIVWMQPEAKLNRQMPNPLGIHVHFYKLEPSLPLVTEQDLDRIQTAGFRRVRMDMLWREIEKEPGIYNFERYDWIIEGLRKRGIRPMIILGLGHPLYDAPSTAEQKPKTPIWVAFERYALATAQHYQGQGIIWELVNEPNYPQPWRPKPDANRYMDLAEQILPKLKAADPSGFIAAPSTAGTPVDFLEICFRRNLLAWVDGVAIHPYQAFPTNRNPENFEPAYRKIRTLIDRYTPRGKHVELLLGEWGYSTAQGELDEDTQAHYLVRQALLGMMVGSPINIWYNWKGTINSPDDTPTEKESNFAIVRPTLEPKPAYLAMQELVQRLRGFSFVRRLSSAPADYVLLFADADAQQQQIIAWTTGKPHSINLQGQTVFLTGKPAYHLTPAFPITPD